MDAAEDYRLPDLPRYVRVNTLKIGLGAANQALKETGHFLCPDPKHPGHRAYHRDSDVPDLLVFKPKGQSDISRIPMVARGEAIVQQKASCFPALALAPPPGACVIDACAAPGNKTSHLAALMQNQGRVYAFELNGRRCELLRDMMVAKGASIVETKHGSFLDASPDDPAYASVTHVLLDPSCSSSGMSRTPESDPTRLRELADAQEELVLHAMRFPAVVAVVYSTCSVFEMENEEVVRKAEAKGLKKHKKRKRALEGGGTRVEQDAGVEDAEMAAQIAACTVRSAYPDDKTIGFFLAKFVKRDKSSGKARQLEVGQELAAKLQILAKMRAKKGKHAAKQAKGHATGTAAGAACSAGAVVAAGQVEVSSEHPAIPQWRLERDSRKKKQRTLGES